MLTPCPTLRNRQALLRILKDPATQQCTKHLGRPESDDAPVCYMGAVMRAMRQSGLDIGEDLTILPITTWAGTSPVQHWEMVGHNDCGVPFPRLAEMLEELPIVHHTPVEMDILPPQGI